MNEVQKQELMLEALRNIISADLLSQNELARMLDIHPMTLAHWMKGKHTPSRKAPWLKLSKIVERMEEKHMAIDRTRNLLEGIASDGPKWIALKSRGRLV